MLRHPLLGERGIAHGFGLRDAPDPPGLLRPTQVHGCDVTTADGCRRDPPPQADGVISAEAGVPVGIVTADCVPILLAFEGGETVAALHAGWRGLAAGVVAQGVDALRRSGGSGRVIAAIGPHIGPCCYEVDAPVLEAMTRAFGAAPVGGCARPVRTGHAMLDLGDLAGRALVSAGLAAEDVGRLADCCTCCDESRFHSFRRDGSRAGRLTHFVAAAQA